MSILNAPEFLHNLPNRARLIAVDHGHKTIGLAITNPERSMVFPMETITYKKRQTALEQLSHILQKRDVNNIIMGWPLNMDGSEGPRCQSVRDFVKDLSTNHPTQLYFLLHDERLSTQRAEERLIHDLDLSRQKRKNVIDQMAAVEILQDFLQ